MTSTRRSFLRTAAVAGGALALPACAAARAPKKPGERLRLGLIGVANRGHDNLVGVRGEEIFALCDVDRRHLDAARSEFPGALAFADYRELLLRRELDAVVISTPDHSHYPAAAMALKRGLDVYCEKPLTHTVLQARRLRELAVAYGAVTQMGTQIHANANYHRVVEAVRAGAVGKVQQVHVFVNGSDWSAKGAPPPEAVPDYLDWDLWLGPANKRPYSSAYHPASWRRYWAFGGGTTADMACHFMDLPFWALELEAPARLRASGPEPDAHGAPRGLKCEYWFERGSGEPALELTWYGGNERPESLLAERTLESWRNGVLFVGDNGWLISNYDKFELGPASTGWTPPPQSVPDSPGHHVEWIEACKQRTAQPSCHFGYSGPLTEAVLLANVLYRAARGQVVAWDSEGTRLGAARANELLDQPLRQGFEA